MGKRDPLLLQLLGRQREVHYAYGAGTNLLGGKLSRTGQEIALAPWDVAIVEEN